MRTLALILAALASVVAAPGEATACSCLPSSPAHSPVDGATNVPLNAVVIASAPGTYLEVELREVIGDVPVPLTLAQGSGFGWRLGTPLVTLKPNTTYALMVDDSSSQTLSMFTTGTTIDVDPIAFTGLTSLEPETMTYPIEQDGKQCFSSCVDASSGHVSRIRLGYTDPTDAPLLVLELYRADDPSHVTTVALQEPLHELGYEPCVGASPVLEPDAEYCARLVAYDIAGNRSGEQEVCSGATRCAPKLDPDQMCTPSDTCEPASSGGCSTSPSTGLLVALGLGLLRRRRR